MASGADSSLGIRSKMPPRLLAFLPFVFYAIHCGRHLVAGHFADLIWACHLANLVLGFAVLLRSRLLLSIAFYWLVQGNILWALDLATGGAFLLTSLLTHVGGLLLSTVWILRAGSSWGSAWAALGVFAGLQVLTRLITPASVNVNLAHQIPEGWEDMAPNFPMYLGGLYAQGLVLFLLCQRLTRRREPQEVA